MRVLIAGATARFADFIIPHLLASPYIHHIVLLSRTSIKSATILNNNKITQLLYPLTEVPYPLLKEYNIDAAIWLIGGWHSKFPNADAAREANVTLPLAFLEGCLQSGIVPTPSGDTAGRATKKQPFRFVYMSMRYAEQNPFARLFSDGANRKTKGAAEKALLALAEERGQGMLEVYCLRLGKVLPGGQSVGNVIWEGMGSGVSETLLAEKTLSLVLGGRGGEKYGRAEGSGVLENNEILGEGWADINDIVGH